MNIKVKKEIEILLKAIKTDTLRWKSGKDISHLEKRKVLNHIPETWKLEDYNNKIIDLFTTEDNELYLYYQKNFPKNYYVFGDQNWIVIIGSDKVIETAFPPDNYNNYLAKGKGYEYLGTIKEIKEVL